MGGRWHVALARFCWISCMAGAVVLLTAAARTQGRPLTACQFEVSGTGQVRAITDGRSFILEDGREVRLAGIEIPLAPAQGESGAKAEAGLAARAALESMLNGQTVELHENGAAVDRYGRTIALAYVIDDRASHSVAHEMLARGFARVSAHVGGGRPCAEELWAQERAARAISDDGGQRRSPSPSRSATRAPSPLPESCRKDSKLSVSEHADGSRSVVAP